MDMLNKTRTTPHNRSSNNKNTIPSREVGECLPEEGEVDLHHHSSVDHRWMIE